MHGLCEKLFILSLKNLIYSILGGRLASAKRGITDLQCRYLKGNEGSGLLRNLARLYVVWEQVFVLQGQTSSHFTYMNIYFYSGEVYSDIKHGASLCASYCNWNNDWNTIPALKRDIAKVCASPVKILKCRYLSFNFLLYLLGRNFR